MVFLLLSLFLLLLAGSWLLLGAGWVTHTHAFLAGSWVTGDRGDDDQVRRVGVTSRCLWHHVVPCWSEYVAKRRGG